MAIKYYTEAELETYSTRQLGIIYGNFSESRLTKTFNTHAIAVRRTLHAQRKFRRSGDKYIGEGLPGAPNREKGRPHMFLERKPKAVPVSPPEQGTLMYDILDLMLRDEGVKLKEILALDSDLTIGGAYKAIGKMHTVYGYGMKKDKLGNMHAYYW